MPEDWTERTAATCMAQGVEFKKCARCPHEITNPLAILQCLFEAATKCTEDGTPCDRGCGNTEAPALGHDFPEGCQTICKRSECEERKPRCTDQKCGLCNPVSIVDVDKNVNRHGIRFAVNPVSDVAEISVVLPDGGRIISAPTLVIYDMTGNVVFERRGDYQSPANNTIIWDLRNSAGRFVANGTYLVIAEAKDRNGKTYQYSARLGVRR